MEGPAYLHFNFTNMITIGIMATIFGFLVKTVLSAVNSRGDA